LRLCAYARNFFLSFVVLTALTSAAFATRIERGIDTFRPKHYLVNLTLDDKLSEITSASVRIDLKLLKPTRAIDLDFGELTVDRVTLDAKSLQFTHQDGKLLINLPGPATVGDSIAITVDYHGKPKDGLVLTADQDGHPTAVGDNWPNRVHHWIPSFDHPSGKATVTFNITAPAGQEVVANGKLDHVETAANGQRTWTYTEGVPIPPYCMVIVVGQFARVEPAGRARTPLSYYVPLSERELAHKGFAPAGPAVEFFTQNIARYPYEKLALIVGATRFGGMENSSAIIFTSTLFSRPARVGMSKTFGVPANNVSLIAHEIAHQWFGDSVTESTWSDLWLSEGFATYFAGLFVQRHEGEEAFQVYLKDASKRVFAYEREHRTPIFDAETEKLMDLLNPNNYEKGAWVLHMLRANLGDAAFFQGIRAYYNSHAQSNASTEDLRRAFEKASGRDLRPFFARWVYDSGHPQYELEWQWSGNKQLRVVLRQVQTGNAFLDPVQVTVSTAGGKRDVVLRPTGKQFTQTIPLNSKPLSIDVDPRNVLLDEATVKGI
jgi:aminopeptidase N